MADGVAYKIRGFFHISMAGAAYCRPNELPVVVSCAIGPLQPLEACTRRLFSVLVAGGTLLSKAYGR